MQSTRVKAPLESQKLLQAYEGSTPRLKKNVPFRRLSAIVLALGIGPSISGHALAQLECESGQADATCRLTLVPGVTLESTGAAFHEVTSSEYRINGDIQVVTSNALFPLNKAEITVKLGDSPELYGETEVPLDQMPLLEDAVFQTIPRAVIGFVNSASIPELVGEQLPLNLGYSEGGTLRDATKPYFLFHLNAGVSFSLDFGEDMKALNKVVFSIPGSLQATAVMDIFDPYVYLAYSKTGGIDLNKLKRRASNDADGDLQVYEILDENDDKVVMAFTLDPETGVLLEQNFLTDTQVYYERNGDGNYVQQNVPDNPAVLAGSQFDDGSPRQQDASDSDDKPKVGDFINAIGFSANGWIPFEARTTGMMPFDVAEFSGQIYMRGEIPMSSFLTLEGDVFTYIGEYGVAQGGNGDLVLGIPGLPDFIDFSIHLGQATAAYKVTEKDQKTFVSGTLKPDTAFLQDYLPIMPTNEAKVEGYVGDDIQNTMLTIEGEMNLGAETLGDWIGVNLNDLYMTRSKMTINGDGVVINGATRAQISPDIQISSEVSVHAALSWSDPEDITLRMVGNMDILGVALEDVTLEVSSRGLSVNGAFVTPVTRVAMAGSITSAGPQLSGAGSISLDLGAISGAMQSAHEDLENAQQEVQRLQSLIDSTRDVVQAERDRAQQTLRAAQDKVDAARSSVNSLNSSIDSHKRAIDSRNAEIRSWHDWYKKAKWHQKATRYARYSAEKAWRLTDIGRHHATIGTLNASLAIAKTALSAANLAMEGVKAGMNFTPIDVDPRVAVLIASKETALLALEIAKQPFSQVPYIDGDLAGTITLSLGIRGFTGTLSAELSGFPLLAGNVETSPGLRACVTVPAFGDACTAL